MYANLNSMIFFQRDEFYKPTPDIVPITRGGGWASLLWNVLCEMLLYNIQICSKLNLFKGQRLISLVNS